MPVRWISDRATNVSLSENALNDLKHVIISGVEKNVPLKFNEHWKAEMSFSKTDFLFADFMPLEESLFLDCLSQMFFKMSIGDFLLPKNLAKIDVNGCF